MRIRQLKDDFILFTILHEVQGRDSQLYFHHNLERMTSMSYGLWSCLCDSLNREEIYIVSHFHL